VKCNQKITNKKENSVVCSKGHVCCKKCLKVAAGVRFERFNLKNINFCLNSIRLGVRVVNCALLEDCDGCYSEDKLSDKLPYDTYVSLMEGKHASK
jgi:hypothetical protein